MSSDRSAQFLLAVSFLLPLILVVIIKTRRSCKWNLPPSPPKLPLIGNLHQLSFPPNHSLHALSKIYGPIMLLKLGIVPTLVVSSSDAAREIMKTHDHIFASRSSLLAMRILFYQRKDITFSVYGEHWRQMRKICVTNLLSMKMVQSFRHVREEEVALMVSVIAKMPGGVVDLSEILHLFASNIIYRSISGSCFRQGRNDVFSRLTHELAVLIYKFSVGDFVPMLRWVDVVSGLEGKLKRLSKKWDEVLDEIIEDHRKGSEEMEGGHGLEKERADDFVDVLLALQKCNDLDFPINEEVIKAILLDMIAAGIDTTSLTLDWCMTELVRNPEKLKILQEEVRSIVTTEQVVREENLSKMIYLKAVVKEILRLHPPAPLLIPRESMYDCKIQGYDIPKKTSVLVNVWGIGRDPKSWEEPEEFRPERFIDSSIDFKGRDFQFIPFGAGRRICAGLQFGVQNLELALANLMRQFDWKLPHGMKSKDLDMAVSTELPSKRKQNLHLVAKYITV